MLKDNDSVLLAVIIIPFNYVWYHYIKPALSHESGIRIERRTLAIFLMALSIEVVDVNDVWILITSFIFFVYWIFQIDWTKPKDKEFESGII